MQDNDVTIIIDAYGFVFRAYYTNPPLIVDQVPVGALYGFTSMLIKVINDFKPTQAVIVFDSGGKTFRHEIYKNYKENRPPVPEDLKVQFPLVREAVQALNLHAIEEKNVEADDVIATLAKTANKNKRKVVIMSSDKDLMQLINDNIFMFDPLKQEYINDEKVLNKFGVLPDKMHDLLSLIGDISDNIPGVKGIGPKSASKLINQYGSLDGVLNNAHKIKSEKQKNNIINSKEDILLSHKLVALKDNLSLATDFNDFKYEYPNNKQIFDFINKYNFTSLTNRIKKTFQLNNRNNTANMKLSCQTQEISSQNDFLEVMHQVNDSGYISFMFYNKSLMLHVNDKCYLINEFSDIYFDILQKCLKDESVIKIVFDLKNVLWHLNNYGLSTDIKSCEDLMLMYSAVSNGTQQLNLQQIIEYIFNYKLNNDDSVIKNTEIVFMMHKLYFNLKQKILSNHLMNIYYDVELPICHILFQMEKNGIYVDINTLNSLSKSYLAQIRLLEKNIFKIANKRFNISSSKQLGVVLFEELKLPYNSWRSQYIVNSDIIEALKNEGFVIANLIFDWMHLSKVKKEHLDPISLLASNEKIHVKFSQVLQNNLTPNNPDLSNIPKDLCSLFIPKKDHMFIIVDYLQIELEILSLLANVKIFKESISNHISIYEKIAKDLFDDIDDKYIQKTKAIIHGILYDKKITDIAKQSNESIENIQKYIKDFFNICPEVLNFINKIKSFASQHGYIRNIFNKKHFISKNDAPKIFFESSISDITKVAIIDINEALSNIQVIMQIHNKIIFQCHRNKCDKNLPILKNHLKNIKQLELALQTNIKLNNKIA